MDRRQARLLLGLPLGYGSSQLETAFRRQAATAHPDRGGAAERFHALVEARRILLSDRRPQPAAVIVVDDHPRVARVLNRLRRLGSAKPRRVL